MYKRHFLRDNIHLRLILHLSICFLALVISRMFMYLLNVHLYAELDRAELWRIIFNGMRFDLSALFILSSPYILFSTLPFKFRMNRIYQALCDAQFYILIILALAVNFIDVIYFRYTGKRMTGDIFKYLVEGGDFRALIPQFIRDFWQPIIAWITLSALTIILMVITKSRRDLEFKNRFNYYFLNTFLFLAMGALTIIGIRGGFQLKPISIITAGKYTDIKNTPLVLNTPFTIAKSVGELELDREPYFRDEQKLDQVFTPVHVPSQNLQGDLAGDQGKLNIVIIIMESFSSEYTGAFNHDLEDGTYTGYTPFLDSLIQQSISFNGFANGKISMDAIPAITASIPALMQSHYITSRYAGNRINSLASLLKIKGYHSSFFHGGTNGTMGFDSFIKMAGFDNYIGRHEYNNDIDYDGQWGIYDEPFFQYFAQCLDTIRQPFLSVFFSLSSHHPYMVPPQYKGKFKKGPLKIHEVIGYSDYCLKRFFQAVSVMDWYKNTLFVITADHTSEAYEPKYQTPVGMYRIPIVFFRPGSKIKGIREEVVQQTDIMPTILDILNYDRKYVAFGKSIMDTVPKRFSVSYIDNNYQLIVGNYAYQWNGQEPVSLFNYFNDPLLEQQLLHSDPQVAAGMENYLKAIIQQFNNRMIDNKLTAD
jgi:phosphoglycerol transferase MdoB-like AlkP superfamily enzyme